jgi:hypothetical protein
MIIPEQEEMLNTPAFQLKLADTITAGVLDFFKVRARPALLDRVQSRKVKSPAAPARASGYQKSGAGILKKVRK